MVIDPTECPGETTPAFTTAPVTTPSPINAPPESVTNERVTAPPCNSNTPPVLTCTSAAAVNDAPACTTMLIDAIDPAPPVISTRFTLAAPVMTAASGDAELFTSLHTHAAAGVAAGSQLPAVAHALVPAP